VRWFLRWGPAANAATGFQWKSWLCATASPYLDERYFLCNDVQVLTQSAPYFHSRPRCPKREGRPCRMSDGTSQSEALSQGWLGLLSPYLAPESTSMKDRETVGKCQHSAMYWPSRRPTARLAFSSWEALSTAPPMTPRAMASHHDPSSHRRDRIFVLTA